MKIKTKRLILRPWENSDIESGVKNLNDLEVSKWLLVVPYPYTVKDAKEWVKRNKKKWAKKDKTDYTFGIELREEKSIIGGIGLHHFDKRQGTAEVGYWLGRNYHRKGYGSEALEAVIGFAFNKLKLRRLEASVFSGNPSSGKLLEKFGFKLEGLKREARVSAAYSKVRDELIYGLLKDDYTGR